MKTLIFVLLMIINSGCVGDKMHRVAIFKNITNENLLLVCVFGRDSNLTKEIHRNPFDHSISGNESSKYYSMFVSSEMGAFFFNKDTIDKYTFADTVSFDVFKKSFRKYIPLKSERNRKDTVYINF